MSSINKNKDEGEEESSQNTPQAITITIMDTSSMDGTTFRAAGLGTTTLRPTIVSSRETQDAKEGSQSLLVVSGNDGSTVSVSQSARDLLQTVTETHMGSEELPVISNISSSEDVCDQSTIQIVTKTGNIEIERVDEAEESEGGVETSSYHCLICNEELQEEQIPVFKTLTTTSQRKVSVYIGILVGQKLTSRKVHSDIICPKCFSLLNRLDLLEIEIRDTKEELVNKYQETVAIHGGRARRRKPAAAKKSDYVFPKIEPDDEDQQAISLEMDETFEPKVDDILDEEHDRREDRDSQDEEWEPEYKRARAKREASETDPRGPPKRKRGRPRKDAAKSKETEMGQLDDEAEELEGNAKRDLNKLLESVPQLRSFFCYSQNLWSLTVLLCNTCKKSFYDVKRVLSHICAYNCAWCNTREKSIGAIIQHLEECSEPHENKYSPLFSCQYCPLFFHEENLWKTHLETHMNECLQKYSSLLKERGLAEIPAIQPPLKRGRPRKTSECTICGSVYAFFGDLQVHIKLKHSDTLPNACRLCPERFMHVQELEYHIIEHFLGQFTCDFCNIHFGLKYPFLKHMESHHAGDFLLKCEFCDYTFSTFIDYRNHRKEPHEDQKDNVNYSKCKYCSELVPLDEAEEHMDEHLDTRDPVPLRINAEHGEQKHSCRKLHHRRKKQICSKCNISFTCPASLSRHNHACHPEIYKRKCNKCGLRFKGYRALELHLSGHANGRCWCPVCKIKFNHREHVEQHFQLAHEDVKFISCEYCAVKLESYRKYVYHCRTMHADLLEDKEEFKCKLCDQVFASRLILKKHNVKDHGINRQNVLKHECSVCKKRFVNLEVHMNLHTRAVQYPCEECGEVFFLKSSLIGHQKLRHDPAARMQHACDSCNKGFISKSLLRTHHEQVHLHKRQHFCEYCGRRYKNKSALTYHLKVHTGDRPYKCQECGIGFHRPSALKTHMEGTHKLPYTYIYRKPNRQKGAFLMTDKTTEDATVNDTDPSVSNIDVEMPKSGIGDINLDEEGLGLVEVVDEAVEDESADGVDVHINESEIVTVVEDLRELQDLCRDENVYIIQVMDD